MSLRKTLRTAAKSAMVSAFSTATHLPAWAKSIDPDALPAYTITTATEQSGFADKDSLQRRADLVVQFMRAGGDAIEDQFDTDADAIEAAVWPALLGVAGLIEAELTATEFRISGEGESRFAVLMLTFTCTYHTDLPAV